MDCWKLLSNDGKKTLVSFLKQYRQQISQIESGVVEGKASDGVNAKHVNVLEKSQSRKRRREESSSSVLFQNLDSSLQPLVEVVLCAMYLYGDSETPSIDSAGLS